MAYVKKTSEKMDLCNCRKFSGILYSYWPVHCSYEFDNKQIWDNAVESMRFQGDYASKYGITLNCKVVNRLNYPLLISSKEALARVKEVDCKNMKTPPDTFHLNVEVDDFYCAIRKRGLNLGHFRIGECNRKVTGKRKIPPG